MWREASLGVSDRLGQHGVGLPLVPVANAHGALLLGQEGDCARELLDGAK